MVPDRDTKVNSLPAACGVGGEYGLSTRGGYSLAFAANCHRLPCATFVPSGRAAIAVAARYARQKHGSGRCRFLLPSYLCHTVIQPFLEMGIDVGFYDAGSDLTIAPERVAERVDERTIGILITQYFGFHQTPDLSLRLQAQFPNICIVDDRTHVLLSDLVEPAVSGDTAVRVYSARKWAPFPDLGIVCWPPGVNPGRGGQRFLDSGYDLPFACTRFAALALRAFFTAFPAAGLRRWSLALVRRADRILDGRVLPRNASPVATLLWRLWDWRPSWEIRRRNFRYLVENWPRDVAKPLYSRMADDVCPLGFPVRTQERDLLRALLVREGVYPPIHWALPSHVPAGEFPQSACLSLEELTIPIDQRYTLRHMDRVLEAAQAYRGLGAQRVPPILSETRS